jgi:hypothetical protein
VLDHGTVATYSTTTSSLVDPHHVRTTIYDVQETALRQNPKRSNGVSPKTERGYWWRRISAVAVLLEPSNVGKTHFSKHQSDCLVMQLQQSTADGLRFLNVIAMVDGREGSHLWGWKC